MKKVLITGGSGGIARAIKVILGAHGFNVFAPAHEEMDVTSVRGTYSRK